MADELKKLTVLADLRDAVDGKRLTAPDEWRRKWGYYAEIVERIEAEGE